MPLSAQVLPKKKQTLILVYIQGSETRLSQNQSWSCNTLCEFQYQWYPFDVQNCYEQLELPSEQLKTKFISAVYTGNVDLGKYYFRGLRFCSVSKFGRHGAYVDLSFKRPLTGHFMTMFLPTGMLLLISQMSTIFSGTFLEMVIEVNTTLLLVFTSL